MRDRDVAEVLAGQADNIGYWGSICKLYWTSCQFRYDGSRVGLL